MEKPSPNIKIGTNIGSPFLGGSAKNISNQITDSFDKYSPEQKQNLAEAAAEIQQILQQLKQSYPTNTTAEQMQVATQAIEQIEANPTLKQRAISAFKRGLLEALKQNPAGAFVAGAIEGWANAEANKKNS